MAIKYRFPLVRDVWCPAFRHWKSVKVCRAQPYEDCQGCGVLTDDRDQYGSRLFRIVESPHYPGPPFTPEVIAVGTEHNREKLRNNKPSTLVSDDEVMTQAFKRLVRKKKKHGSKRHRR